MRKRLIVTVVDVILIIAVIGFVTALATAGQLLILFVMAIVLSFLVDNYYSARSCYLDDIDV
jgi:uncharacterized membrane-anchored protein YitT (DUF2179 family)